jgi:toxin CptA
LSNRYATPLRLEPGRSVQLAGWLLAVHVTAMLLVPWLPLPSLAQLALGCALLGNLLWIGSQHALRITRWSLRSFTWQIGPVCRVQLVSGVEFDAVLGPQAFVQPWLVILPYRVSRWRSHYLLLLPDMLDPDTLRRLRVRLRMELTG